VLWHLLFVDIGEVAVYCPGCAEREFGGSRKEPNADRRSKWPWARFLLPLWGLARATRHLSAFQFGHTGVVHAELKRNGRG